LTSAGYVAPGSLLAPRPSSATSRTEHDLRADDNRSTPVSVPGVRVGHSAVGRRDL